MSVLSRGAAVFTSTSILALVISASGTAFAGTVSAAPPVDAPEVQEVIVTAAKGKASEAAPVSSSLKATEPQAVITRKFIEEAAPRVGDYTTTAILAPSMATTPNSNGSGATDGAKITLRGFQDGEFNVTYDGIAWGDTNGPSHHSNSFFPSSVIGGVVIDRGPGQASDLGQANFGGSVNLFSLPFEDRPGFRQTATLGSFGTRQAVTTLESGPVAGLHDANVVANFMEYSTDGYLTNSPSDGQNQFIKGSLPINDKWSVTALFTRNEDEYNQGDNNANATVAQTELYGKRFALSNDPQLATYKGYNYTRKQTDFEYLRVNGDLGRGLTMDNTVYSYFYSNNTLSANNNGADYSLDPTYTGAGFGPNLTKANTVDVFPGNTPNLPYPAAGKGYTTLAPGSAPAAGKLVQTVGIPGYTKRNEYRVTGDIIKFYQDTPWGKLTVGAEYEHAFTQRQRFDYDLGPGLGLSTYDFRETAATFANASASGHCNYPVQASNGACEVPLNTAYSEFSGWNQYQPFAEFDWKPTDHLTITPGVKYVHFDLFIHAPELAVKGSIQPSYVDGTYTKTLPFLTVNYRYQPNWSFYAQYAQGFLVPNVSAFYINEPQNSKVVPQESTNYQIGTVLSAGKFTFDGDVYYIDFKHKIQNITDIATNETYETNSGGATYKGIELQGTYLLPYGFSTFGNISVNQASGNGDPLVPGGNGHQLAHIPRGTAALGLRYEHHGLFAPDDAIVTNLNTKWIGQQYSNVAADSTKASAAPGAPTAVPGSFACTIGGVAQFCAPPAAIIHAFNETNWTTTYRIKNYSLEFQVLNLFDHRAITSAAKGAALLPNSDELATTVATGGGANVFTYQVERSYQVTLKVAF